MEGWSLHIALSVSLKMVQLIISTALSSSRVSSRIIQRTIKHFTRVWYACLEKFSPSASRGSIFQLSSWNLKDSSRLIFLMKVRGVRKGAEWKKSIQSFATLHLRNSMWTRRSAKQTTIKWNRWDTDLNKDCTCAVLSTYYQSKSKHSFFWRNQTIL